MKNVFRVALLSLIFSLVLTSCSDKKKIKLTETNFSDEISLHQRLEFTFDHDIAPDSLFNLWDSTEYIKFNPEVQGMFKWVNSKQLVFSPEEPFLPSTEYTAMLKSTIVSFISKGFRLKLEELSFHTPYLIMEKSNAYWAMSEDDNEKADLNINLRFNYEVSSEQIMDLLVVSVNDEKVDFSIKTSGNSGKIDVAVLNPDVDVTKATSITIRIDEGLKCANSEWESEKSFKSVLEIPPKDKLMVTSMMSGFEEGRGVITVNTTQKIISPNLRNLVIVDPKVNFEVKALVNGIRISGDFIEGNSYKVKIKGKIMGVFGKEMGEDYSQYVSFGKVEPFISFIDENAIYLSSKGNKNLGANIINIPKVRLRIFKIYENNIIQYMRKGKRWDYYYEGNEYHDMYTWEMDEKYGKEVLNKVIDTKSLSKNGNISLLNIDLTDINYADEFKGLYIVKLESIEKRWLQAAQLISVSDIGLIVKEGINNIKVYANSILDAKPLSGVKVSFISSNNQKVYTATTDNEGVAILNDVENKIPGSTISMVTAQKAEDFNYILFNRSRVEKSRFDVGGKRIKGVNYDVFIYGDRDIYRPGDSVYVNTVLRTMDREIVKDIPVKIKIVLPNGRKLHLFKKQLDNEGSAEVRFHLPDGVLTGIFTIEVYSANDIFLKSSRIKVEEFMPDRIKVAARLDKEMYEADDTLSISVNAMNLFGPPAANRKYECEMQLNRRSFVPKDLNDYIFNITLANRIRFDRKVREGKTDDEGNATENFRLPAYENIGVLSGRIYTTVFDETGRPVNRLSVFDVYTQDVFYGIKRFDYWRGTRDPLKVGFIAADRDGKVLNGIKAKVKVKYITWETVIERRGNSYRYNSQKKEILVYSNEITLKGTESVIDYTPMNSGRYEVQIMSVDDNSYVSSSFYAYGWGDTDYNSFEVNKDGEITMEFDKESYEIGDQAKILFKSPFNGNILVTVEREDVIDHFYLKTNKKAASLNLKIRDNFLPNVYITATAIRKINDANIPLMVAHGFAPLLVEELDNKLDVTIDAVEKSRSKTKQRIKVKTKPNTELTIAVVDEGILQLTNFQTPDPYEYFYRKRALEVSTYDIYSFLFPELIAAVSSPGGGAGMDMGKRINPLAGKRVKLISFWSGIMKSGSNGECEFEIDIPQFSGALRVMAVAYKGDKFGMAEHEIKVADPIVISTALPRFLSPGDNAKVPVTVTNTTNKASKAKVRIIVEGPLKAREETSISIDLKANAEQQVLFDVLALQEIGIAKVKVYVDAFNEEFSEIVSIPVRPAAGLIKISDAGMIKGDETKIFEVTTDFIENSTASSILLSKSPMAEFSKDLSTLIRYPYGCIEQTVSRAFPLIYYRELAQSLEQEKNAVPFNPDYFVQKAISKIETMQQYNGGLTYWPGGGYINWWATAYAAHFLYEAGNDGFEINTKVLNNSYNYLKQMVKKKDSREYYYYENGVSKRRTIAKREVFYSLYVLALAGKQNQSVMNYYKSNLHMLSTDSKYLLAATYALIGDKYSSQAIIPVGFGEDQSQRTRGGCFNSPIREKAIALYTMLESDPDNGQIGFLAKSLSEEMKRKRWLSTQERAFSLLALGKLAKKAAEENVSATLKIDGQSVAEFTGKMLTVENDLNNKSVEIITSGEGRLYYFYEVEGISKSGKYKEGDSHLKVRKMFFDRFGNQLTSNSFEQNDLVIVKISITSLEDSKVENVAITDILPACFEIENPRIRPDRQMEWIKDKSHPDYMDIRDDRISYFTDVTKKTQNFYYMVRVVSKGTYKMGPVGADAMYDGQYHSYSGGRTIKVN